jgi:bacillithiol biosynthesis deacetylase BshB1
MNVLAVGAHPDDVEVGIGGLVHKLAKAGHTVGILDLCRGECATRGSVEERHAEATEAARILGVTRRENAGLPDGAIANTDEQRRVVVPLLKSFEADVLLAPFHCDHHPDHEAAHALMRDANHLAGLAKYDGNGAPHRAKRVFFYRVYRSTSMPTMVVDISDEFVTKLDALRAYKSQFHNPDYEGIETHVASEEFWRQIETKAAYWGGRVGVRFGEPLYHDGPVGVGTLPGLAYA